MCIGEMPPFDHPHVFLDMGDATEIICPYCSTLFRYDAASAPARRVQLNARSRNEISNRLSRTVDRWSLMAVVAHRDHCRRGHRRAVSGLAIARRGIPRRRIRPGATTGRGRRRHSAFAQCLAHPDRARARAAIAALRRGARGIADHERAHWPRAGARAARRHGRETLWRPLLGDPPRRSAGGAARRGARRTEDHAAPRHARRGLRVPLERRDGLRAVVAPLVGRTRHRLDWRRRAVVEPARSGWGIAASRALPATPHGERWPRPTRSHPSCARPRSIYGSAAMPISSTIPCGAAA